MNKKLLLLAGILAIGTMGYAADAAAATTGGDKSTINNNENTENVSFRTSTDEELAEAAAEATTPMDYFLSDHNITGDWTQTLTTHKEVTNGSYTSRRVDYLNEIGLHITPKLTLNLEANQTINTPHQSSASADHFESSLDYRNGEILGTEVTSAQLLTYHRDGISTEYYTLRQRFGFLSYLGEYGSIGNFDVNYSHSRAIGGSDDKSAAFLLDTAWKFGEASESGYLQPRVKVGRTLYVGRGYQEDNGYVNLSLKYLKDWGLATDTLGKLQFTTTASDTTYTDGHNSDGHRGGATSYNVDLNGGHGYLDLKLAYDKNLYTSQSGYTKLDFHTQIGSSVFSWDHDQHSKPNGNVRTRKDEVAKTLLTNTYLKVKQDLTATLDVSLEAGIDADFNYGMDRKLAFDKDKRHEVVNGYVEAKVTYIF